eukprot:206881-Amphidinium_carterae.1
MFALEIEYQTNQTYCKRDCQKCSDKAGAAKSISGSQMIGLYFQPVCMTVLAYVRVSVSDLMAGLPAPGDERKNAIAASSFGVIVQRPYEAALGMTIALILSAFAVDILGAYSMVLSITSQAARGAAIVSTGDLPPTAELLASFVTYQTQSLWSVRNLVLRGELMTPTLSKLFWVSQAAAGLNDRRARDNMSNELNHVAHLVGLKSTAQSRNHIAGSLFEARAL